MVGAQYATGDQWKNNSRKNEEMEPEQKQYPVVDGTGDRSKVRCCKEQYCIGTWNVRSMNQGKLEVVTQEMAPKKKQHPTVDVTGDRSKVPCCKQQYCIGTWTVRSMNQGKFEVVKQEMARVNVDILGISELKWTRMGEF